MKSKLTNFGEYGGERGRKSSGVRTLAHAEAVMVVVREEIDRIDDPTIVKLKWLTERLRARGIKSPEGAELNPSTVTRIVGRCGHTVFGLKMGVVARLLTVSIDDARRFDSGNLVEHRRANISRRINRHLDTFEKLADDLEAGLDGLD